MEPKADDSSTETYSVQCRSTDIVMVLSSAGWECKKCQPQQGFGSLEDLQQHLSHFHSIDIGAKKTNTTLEVHPEETTPVKSSPLTNSRIVAKPAKSSPLSTNSGIITTPAKSSLLSTSSRIVTSPVISSPPLTVASSGSLGSNSTPQRRTSARLHGRLSKGLAPSDKEGEDIQPTSSSVDQVEEEHRGRKRGRPKTPSEHQELEQEDKPSSSKTPKQQDKFKCSQEGCCTAFPTLQQLVDHISQLHKQEKQTCSCSFCGEIFLYRPTRLRHLQKVHGVSKTPKHMQKKRSTKKASESTNGKKGCVTCHLCGEEFAYRSTRIRHMERDHGTSRTLWKLKHEAMKAANVTSSASIASRTRTENVKPMASSSVKESETLAREGETERNSENFSFDHLYAAVLPVGVSTEKAEQDLQKRREKERLSGNENENAADSIESLFVNYVDMRAIVGASLLEPQVVQNGNSESQNGNNESQNGNNENENNAVQATGNEGKPNSEKDDCANVTSTKVEVNRDDNVNDCFASDKDNHQHVDISFDSKTDTPHQSAKKDNSDGKDSTSTAGDKSKSKPFYDSEAFITFERIFENIHLHPLPQCDFCGHPFPDAASLASHVEHYRDEKPVQCKTCERSFHSLRLLNIHIFFDHDVDSQAVCLACKEKFSCGEDLLEHFEDAHSGSLSAAQLRLDSMDVRQCMQCQLVLFNDARLMDVHLKAHGAKKKTEPQLSCGYCSAVFDRKYLVQLHQWLRHYRDEAGSAKKLEADPALKVEIEALLCDLDVRSEKYEPATSQRLLSAVITFFCSLCKKELNNSGSRAILQHVWLHYVRSNQTAIMGAKMYLCPDCGDEIPDVKTNVSYHRLEHGHMDGQNSKLKCSVCSAFFKRAADVLRHEKLLHGLHNQVVSAVCDTCGMKFTDKLAFDSHVQLHKDSQTLFHCDVCRRGFKLKAAMERHRARHDTTPPTICPHCPKEFLRASYLSEHVKTVHLGIYRFKCDKCPAQYSESIQLRDHIATKHEGKRPYSCGFCPQTFVCRPTLKRHIRRDHEGQTPFVCDVCGESFHERHYLQRHKVTHGEAEPFTCPHCQKAFRSDLSVQKHIRTIHQELLGDTQMEGTNASFLCLHCQLEFPSESDLAQHTVDCTNKHTEAGGVTKIEYSLVDATGIPILDGSVPTLDVPETAVVESTGMVIKSEAQVKSLLPAVKTGLPVVKTGLSAVKSVSPVMKTGLPVVKTVLPVVNTGLPVVETTNERYASVSGASEGVSVIHITLPVTLPDDFDTLLFCQNDSV